MFYKVHKWVKWESTTTLKLKQDRAMVDIWRNSVLSSAQGWSCVPV